MVRDVRGRILRKKQIERIRDTRTHSILLIQGLLHLDQLLHGQNMLARPDALHHVRWTCAGITGAGRREVNDIFVEWNGAGRNSISIFGPRNAHRSYSVLACGLADYLTRFLGSMYAGIPLDSFRHCSSCFVRFSFC